MEVAYILLATHHNFFRYIVHVCRYFVVCKIMMYCTVPDGYSTCTVQYVLKLMLEATFAAPISWILREQYSTLLSIYTAVTAPFSEFC